MVSKDRSNAKACNRSIVKQPFTHEGEIIEKCLFSLLPWLICVRYGCWWCVHMAPFTASLFQMHKSFRMTTTEVPGFPWQQILGSYRSQARWTDRLLSSTPATMSSMAFQSSLLRMLPVLSDTLSAPREGGSCSSSTADKSYQIKKGSKL